MSIGRRLFDLVRSNLTPLRTEATFGGTFDPRWEPQPAAASQPRRSARGSATAADAQRLRWYKVLELPPGSDREQVRRAYRRLLLRFHPDRFAGDPQKQRDATIVTRALTEAHDRLTRELGV